MIPRKHIIQKKKRMKRRQRKRSIQNLFILLMIFLLVVGQGLDFVLAAGNASQLNATDFGIQVDDNSTKEKAIILITPTNNEVEGIEVLLPKNTIFNIGLTKEINNGNTEINYDQAKHHLNIDLANNPSKEVSIVLTDIQNENNALSIKGLIEDEIIGTADYLFVIELAGPEEEVETPEELDEEIPSQEEAEIESLDEENQKTEIAETDDEIVSEEEKSIDESNDAEESAEETEKEKKTGEPESESVSVKQNVDMQGDLSTIVPFMGDLNTDIDISPVKNTILSGQDALYRLTLKLTGSKREYKNVDLVVDLPISEHVTFDDSNLDSLAINDVTPSYDSDTHQLKYHFEEIKRGQTYEKIISLNTTNGSMVDGTELSVTATISGDIHFTENDEAAKEDPIEIVPFEYTDDATVKVSASSSIDLSKEFNHVLGQSHPFAVRGSDTQWTIKLDIPKKEIGQAYLQEDTMIKITDSLPAGLEYVRTISGPEPVSSGTQLTWEIQAPSIEEQTNAPNSLYSTEVVLELKVKSNAVIDSKQVNEVTADAVFIEDKTMTVTASDEVQIFDASWADTEHEGITHDHFWYGPDGTGGAYNADAYPVAPDVPYWVESLDYSVYLVTYPYAQWRDFDKYKTVMNIDPNLIFRELTTPAPFQYRPNGSYPHGMIMENQPKYDIYGIVNGVEKRLVENANHSTTYSRSDLGLLPTDEIASIIYDFTYAPAGMDSDWFDYNFEVKPGYRGLVTNEYIVYTTMGTGDDAVDRIHYGFYGHGDHLRSANIIDIPTNSQPPTATVGVELMEQEDGEVSPGENRLEVKLNNLSSSTIPMKEDLESVVLLPLGVTLDENSDYKGFVVEKITEDYNGSGRQLVKITWDDEFLRPGSSLVAEFDVTISTSAPTTLQFDVYGFSGDEVLNVPTSQGTSITDTVLQIDTDDLNDNGNNTQPRLKSGNTYVMTGSYDLQTEKLVKGELDDEFSLFGKTLPGGAIDYKLKVTNTTGQVISTMTLIDVLPSVGDLGITDNIDRGSKFAPIMMGPITLPAEWVGKVDVVYSTAKNPERDDLTKNTVYPDSTEQLTNPEGAQPPNWVSASQISDWSTIHSFKMELKDGVEWIQGNSIVIDFDMKAPEETDVAPELLDSKVDAKTRAAWNSFAIATNHGQPVEPHRVGVAMDFDIVEPEVEKTVNDQKETVELLNRDELFTWKVDYDFGNYTANWSSVVLSDQIHELLDIESVKVVDQDSNDVNENGQLTTVDNLVKFEVNKQDDSFAYLADQTYTLIIESKIKDSATDEQLQSFVEGNGIPNEGILTIDDDPKKSNEVFVKPPGHGSLEIIKVDDTTGTVLQGAEFELRACEDDAVDANDEEKCKVIASGTTDENGKLLFGDIPLGDYKLVETKAPEGYNILTAPLDIKIVDSGQVLEFEVENTKTGWELPKSGGIGTLLFYGGGILLMLLAAFMLFRNKKANQ